MKTQNLIFLVLVLTVASTNHIYIKARNKSNDDKIMRQGFLQLLYTGYNFVNSQEEEERREAVETAVQIIADLFSLTRNPVKRMPPVVHMQQCLLHEHFVSEICKGSLEHLPGMTP